MYEKFLNCHSPAPGVIEIGGAAYTLSGASATDATAIAEHLKDALAAASINKSGMKLKLVDIKNGGGEVVETVLQAEYDRPGMVPIPIWHNTRGEAGTLAAILRKALQ